MLDRLSTQESKLAKFKVGDKVEVIKDYGSSIAIGTHGITHFLFPDEKGFTLVKFYGRDDLHNGAGRSDYDDCWWFPDDCLKLVEPKAEKSDKHWIIAVQSADGRPQPAHRPFVHTFGNDAIAEAGRLATENPGQRFVVYTASFDAYVDPPAPFIPNLTVRSL